jgi:hypothetical protein
VEIIVVDQLREIVLSKPDVARAIAVKVGAVLPASYESTGDTITADWHRAVGAARGVPYTSNKPAHMAELLRSVGVAWDPARHESHQDPLPDGDNIMLAAYEDLLAALP